MLSLFSASLDRTEDWRTGAASTPSKTLQRPGPGRWLRSTICARWTRFSHVIWFLPVWCCKNLIWLRSRPQVVGDGNFAVVRVCYSRQTRKEFAVKIIDKVKANHRHRLLAAVRWLCSRCPLFMDLDICNVVSGLELIAHFWRMSCFKWVAGFLDNWKLEFTQNISPAFSS